MFPEWLPTAVTVMILVASAVVFLAVLINTEGFTNWQAYERINKVKPTLLQKALKERECEIDRRAAMAVRTKGLDQHDAQRIAEAEYVAELKEADV